MRLLLIGMMSFLSLFEFASEPGEYPAADQQRLLTAFQKEVGAPFNPVNAQHRAKMAALVKQATAVPKSQQFVVHATNAKGHKETFETIAISPEEAVKKLQYLQNNTLKILDVVTRHKNVPTLTAR